MRKLPIGLRKTLFVSTRDVPSRLTFFMLTDDVPVSKKYKVLQKIFLSGQKSSAIFFKNQQGEIFSHKDERETHALKNNFPCVR